MRKTRYMSLMFLFLALAFFLLPEFRQALRVPFYSLNDPARFEQLARAGQVPEAKLKELAQRAEREGNARTLAFVALHASTAAECDRLGRAAVQREPGLTWIYYTLATRFRQDSAFGDWTARLQSWDPTNAIPFLLEAEQIHERRQLPRETLLPEEGIEALAREAEWRQVMERAFAAPHYDSYARRRFELERSVLRRHELDSPLIMIVSLSGYPIPYLLNARQYATLLVSKIGQEAEKAGRTQEALQHYWTVARFAERMRLEGASLIERLIGGSLQVIAYERILPVLQRLGRKDEAAVMEYVVEDLRQHRDQLQGKDPLVQSSNPGWAVMLVHLGVALVALFGVLTVLALGYVNAKRWVRTGVQGRLYQVGTIAENYLPLLFFLACLSLYLTYLPYAQNYEHYMTASGPVQDFEPFFSNVFPNFGALPGRLQLPLEAPFRPYVWYALAGVALATVLSLLGQKKD